jgi:pilus assembly protein CpaE
VLADARDLAIETHVIDSRQRDPLHGVAALPDLLLLRVGASSVHSLEALAAYPPAERPPLIVIGDVNHPGCMRAAMRAGARDFLMEPVAREELLASITRIAAEHKPARTNGHCRTTAFINAKGGSGATFLACNIAHLFAGVSNMQTALLDLDLQFGALPRYLDIQPKRSLLEALDVADDLDGTAIDAYLTKHESGLAVLAGLRDTAMLQQELMTDRFEAVLALLAGNFEQLVIDVPRHIEPFGAIALERADQIVLVMQQSVPSLHDAARMYDVLTRNLAIHGERISIVVNRYHRAASVELGDIEQSFGDKTLICIPNDFRAVTESINIGVPIYQYARRSSVTKALMRLEKQLGGKAADVAKSFFPMLRGIG